MRTTIDNAGRLVIPKAVRDQAGLHAGAEVSVEFRDGRIEIEPTTAPMHIVADRAGAKIEPDGEMPVLTTDSVRQVLERTRR